MLIVVDIRPYIQVSLSKPQLQSAIGNRHDTLALPVREAMYFGKKIWQDSGTYLTLSIG